MPPRFYVLLATLEVLSEALLHPHKYKICVGPESLYLTPALRSCFWRFRLIQNYFFYLTLAYVKKKQYLCSGNVISPIKLHTENVILRVKITRKM